MASAFFVRRALEIMLTDADQTIFHAWLRSRTPSTRQVEWPRVITPSAAEGHTAKDLTADNSCTLKQLKGRPWLEHCNQTRQQRYACPCMVLHFTPMGAAWLNVAERLFRDSATRRLRGDIIRSVKQLVAAIEHYLRQ